MARDVIQERGLGRENPMENVKEIWSLSAGNLISLAWSLLCFIIRILAPFEFL